MEMKRPDESVIRSVQDAYERGQMLEALERAQEFARLKEWGGAQGCALASGIATHTGGYRLALRLAVRARRTDQNQPEGLAQYAYEVLSRRGPLAAWEVLRDWREDQQEHTVEQRAELLALKGLAATELRDFATPPR